MLLFAYLKYSFTYDDGINRLGKYINKPLEAFEFLPWSDATPQQTGNYLPNRILS